MYVTPRQIRKQLGAFPADETKTGLSSVDRSAVEPEFSHPIAKYAFQYALAMK